MTKINFKRKTEGRTSWGVGLDYLCKDYWGKLDKLVRDNYFGKHDQKLINFLFPNISAALDKSIARMKALCDKDSPGLKKWTGKARKIQRLATSSRSLSKKVIFIDTAVQFLRATSTRDKKKALEKKFAIQNRIIQLKGSVASCAGEKIRGIAKVVLNEKDFSKIKKGEILITRETNPDFLPVMKKAIALVADLGGLLCHMAIVARELKKPCIVNTKIATAVFKDGDIMEIDTKQGVVKIIKRAG